MKKMLRLEIIDGGNENDTYMQIMVRAFFPFLSETKLLIMFQ